MMALTSFDLSLPPVVVTTPEQASQVKSEQDVLNLLLAVRMSNKSWLEHSGNGGFRRRSRGSTAHALDTLQALMTQIHQQYPQNNDVLVIPSDDVQYDDVMHVLERLRLALYGNLARDTRARDGPRGAAARRGSG